MSKKEKKEEDRKKESRRKHTLSIDRIDTRTSSSAVRPISFEC